MNHFFLKSFKKKGEHSKKIFYIFFSLLFISTSLILYLAQQIGVSLSNNVTSLLVTGFPKAFFSQFHPGIDVFKDWKINKKKKNPELAIPEEIWVMLPIFSIFLKEKLL